MHKAISIWKTSLFRIILACFGTHTTSLMVGLCQGYSAILIPQLMVDSNMIIDSESGSWIASLGVISNPIGAIVAGFLSEWCGRKRTVQMSSIPYFMGWLIISQSMDNYSLGIGRFITGLGVGMITTTFTYIAEITPASQRGVLSAFGPVVTSFGVLLIYVMGYFFHWQLVAVVCVVISTFVIVIMQIIPESPPWLIGKERFIEAFNALKWLNMNNMTAAEKDFTALLLNCKFENNVNKLHVLEQIRNETIDKNGSGTYCPNCVLDDLKIYPNLDPQLFIQNEKNQNHESDNTKQKCINNSKSATVTPEHIQSKIATILSPRTYKPFVILIMFFLFQELSGIYIILFYSVNFLDSVGINLNDYIGTIIVGSLRFVASIIGAMLIQKYARKTLATISGGGMCVSVCETLYSEHFIFKWIPLISILSAVMFSMFGFLQLPYVMNSELFPLQVRGIMSGFVLSIANIFIFISIKVYPNMLEYLSVSSILFLFGCTSLMGAIYCYLFLPETNNKSLSEIEASFTESSSSCNTNNSNLSKKSTISKLVNSNNSNNDSSFNSVDESVSVPIEAEEDESKSYVNQSYTHDEDQHV
ncbi:facilitated trehalose transporter Tret1-like isoform X2 [Chrysoperla carnea]|uniref:facilitated trehalose transporter Tret1-like isoform X2 n=1 Tax=Chrysoperla carnea TaxID=189513 RepID=UPI001D064E87|nr:facilitated trehalose transporter Tret1-like isoform X2 [Chrysoperla carnea]